MSSIGDNANLATYSHTGTWAAHRKVVSGQTRIDFVFAKKQALPLITKVTIVQDVVAERYAAIDVEINLSMQN